MKIYTIERMDKFDYDFSVELKKCGCYVDKEKALQRAKEVYEGMCGEHEDEMKEYSDEDEYPEVCDGALEVEEDSENGYYFIGFGFEEHHECHSIAVEEWELDDEQHKINDDEWFGKVRWCNEDLEEALDDNGYPVTENNISKLRRECDNHWFTDHMIEAGWEYINAQIGYGDGWDE